MKLEIAISFPSMGKVHLPDPASLLSLDPPQSTLAHLANPDSFKFCKLVAADRDQQQAAAVFLGHRKEQNGLLRHHKKI